MQASEVTVEGIHIRVKPEWESAVQAGIAHLDARHPGTIRRAAVRFRPIKPHRDGVHMTLDGRVDQVHFHVERDGENVVALIHESFSVAERTVTEAKARESNVRAIPEPALETVEVPEESIEGHFLQLEKQEAAPPQS